MGPEVVIKAQVIHTDLRNTDLQYSKAPPNKIKYERLSPSPAFRPHDITQHTLQLTTKHITEIAMSAIQYSM
jgi:hypothetical protein